MAKRGEAWERKLELWHRAYQLAGDGFILRCHPEARLNPATGRLYYAADGPPDFCGWAKGVGSVIFDAKEVAGERFMFKNLPGHQAIAFSEAAKYGSFAFLAVRFTGSGRMMVFPWKGALGDHYRAWTNGHALASIPADYGCAMTGEGWLETVRRLM